MTHPELQVSQEDMWRVLVSEQRTTVAHAVEMVSRCNLPPKQILTKSMNGLEGSHLDS
jgi:hypothetical protein